MVPKLFLDHAWKGSTRLHEKVLAKSTFTRTSLVGKAFFGYDRKATLMWPTCCEICSVFGLRACRKNSGLARSCVAYRVFSDVQGA